MFGLCLPSCAGYPGLRQIAPEINATFDPEVFVVAGDQIGVRFPQRSEWDHQSLVREDGKATFPFIGDLTVAGLSTQALNKKLADAFASQEGLGAGTVFASLVQAVGRQVVVIGEVRNPGPHPFGRGALSFVEAIGRAGGPVKGSALLEEAMLVRWSPSQQRHLVWRLDASIEEWKAGAPLMIQSHDLIYIPNNTIDRINVWVDKYIRQNLPLPFAWTVN
jgi:protein involved in polysaccharide export with SLBB domain